MVATAGFSCYANHDLPTAMNVVIRHSRWSTVRGNMATSTRVVTTYPGWRGCPESANASAQRR